MFGGGLECFLQGWRYTDGAFEHAPKPLNLLVLQQDEGSIGYAVTWYFLYHLSLRCVCERDPLHREWNDAKNALQNCGAWGVVTAVQHCINVVFGPWSKSGWWAKLPQAAEEYFAVANHDDSLFLAMYERISRDMGHAPLEPTLTDV